MKWLGICLAGALALVLAACGGSSSSTAPLRVVTVAPLVDFHLCFGAGQLATAQADATAFYRSMGNPTARERFDAAVERCDAQDLLLEEHGSHGARLGEAVQRIEESCEAWSADRRAMRKILEESVADRKAAGLRVREYTDLCEPPTG
jgi:hypothetical protein